jgi:hypothetical protein
MVGELTLEKARLMATAQEQLDNFYQYAIQQLVGGQSYLSVEELLDLWRIENPSSDGHSDSVTAINAAVEDYRNGDRGHPAGEVSRELREHLKLPRGE